MTAEVAVPSTFRYRPVLKIASGGMGAVYVGFHSGAAGFRRPVAIKRAHPHLLESPEFREMLITESRLASLVRHPNIAGVCDVEEADGELLLIMDYVEGASLSELLAATPPLPTAVALRIILDVCHGLQAIHSACDSRGVPLGLVHRDISPQNILVGIDGVARIADFGIAKASQSTTANMTGGLRGKPGYMAPEYITSGVATTSCDIFALGVVAWEVVARRRLFKVASDIETLERVRNVTIPPPSVYEPGLPPEVEAAIFRAIARSPHDRHASAGEFATSLESAVGQTPFLSRHAAVGAYVHSIVGERLEARRCALAEEASEPGVRPMTFSQVDIEVERTKSVDTPLSGMSIGPVAARRRGTSTNALIALMSLALVGLGVERGLNVSRPKEDSFAKDNTSVTRAALGRSASPAPMEPPLALVSVAKIVVAPTPSAQAVPKEHRHAPPAVVPNVVMDRRPGPLHDPPPAEPAAVVAAPSAAPAPPSPPTAEAKAPTPSPSSSQRAHASSLVATPPSSAPENPYE